MCACDLDYLQIIELYTLLFAKRKPKSPFLVAIFSQPFVNGILFALLLLSKFPVLFENVLVCLERWHAIAKYSPVSSV